MLHVTDAHYIDDYRIWLSFDDGSVGEVDLFNHLKGEVFTPLKDKNFFKKVRYNPEISTICWPNGADFAPEFLRHYLQ